MLSVRFFYTKEDPMDEKERAQYEKLIRTPVVRLIPSLAVPTVISMLISMIYNLVDAYFVGKLGTSASAAIGIMISVQAVFQAVGFMCGHGCGSCMSRQLGSGNHTAADRYVSTGFFTAIAIGTVLAVPGLVFKTPLMRFLGSTDTILPYAESYGFYILAAGPAFAASAVLNNVMRYEGKAVLAMVGLVSGGVLNMIGDPVLMFGLHMGIDGAGLSTAVSQYISFFILLWMFISGRTITRISLAGITRDVREFLLILRNGMPSLIRQMLNSVATMTLNICAAPYGDAAIAAMTIVGRVTLLMGSVMIGIGQGFQPVSAFNYGASKFKRVREGFWFTSGMGALLLTGFACFAFLFPASIIRIFRDDAEVVRIGTPALRYMCVAVILQPVSVSANMMFQSIGKSRTASFLSALRSGLYYIPLLLLLPRFIGIAGIQSAQMFSDILTLLTTVPFLVRFFRELPREDRRAVIDEMYEGKERE